MAKRTPSATIAGLNHDLKAKRSIVILTWDDDPDKRLALPVPFGCTLEALPAAAEKALRELSAETALLRLNAAP